MLVWESLVYKQGFTIGLDCLFNPWKVCVEPVLAGPFLLAKCGHGCVVNGVLHGVSLCCGLTLWQVLDSLVQGGHVLFHLESNQHLRNVNAGKTFWFGEV